MRINVLQTWTAGSLLLTASVVAATAMTTRTPAVSGARLSPLRIAHCAAPAALRRLEIGHAAGSGKTTAMLLMLMAQRGRFGGLAR